MKRLINTGEYDADLTKYISGILDLVLQGMTENINTKEQVAHISYKDMENLEFQILLTSNYYTNPNSMHICFPMKKKKETSDKNGDIDTDLINTCKYFFFFFFCYLIKEVPITKYGNDKQLMLNLSPYEIISFLTKC